MTPPASGDVRNSRTCLASQHFLRLPKVELHAHFFGSIRLSCIQRIAESKKLPQGPVDDIGVGFTGGPGPVAGCLLVKKSPDLVESFKYFSWVYSVITSASDIRQALLEVLEDFHNDNVVYLELRSSLKRIPEEGVDPQSYVDILVEGCKEAQRKWGMTVRLLVSLDRSRMTDDESSRLQVDEAFSAASRYPEWIVGFDIAGRPDKGNLHYSLCRLKEEVISSTGRFFGTKKVTVHTAEIKGCSDTEEILRLPPNRVGHGCYLTGPQRADVARRKICVEVCPTSNQCTLNLKDMCDHPLQLQHGKGLGLRDVCICTDDVGLFQTSLSKELETVARAYNLSLAEVFDMQRTALDAAFCPQEVKDKLRDSYFSDLRKKEFLQSCTEPPSACIGDQ